MYHKQLWIVHGVFLVFALGDYGSADFDLPTTVSPALATWLLPAFRSCFVLSLALS